MPHEARRCSLCYNPGQRVERLITQRRGRPRSSRVPRHGHGDIIPAAVVTDLFQQMSPAHIQSMLARIPMGRFGQPTEIAALVAWLASEECSFSTGGMFDISGGRATY